MSDRLEASKARTRHGVLIGTDLVRRNIARLFDEHASKYRRPAVAIFAEELPALDFHMFEEDELLEACGDDVEDGALIGPGTVMYPILVCVADSQVSAWRIADPRPLN